MLKCWEAEMLFLPVAFTQRRCFKGKALVLLMLNISVDQCIFFCFLKRRVQKYFHPFANGSDLITAFCLGLQIFFLFFHCCFFVSFSIVGGWLCFCRKCALCSSIIVCPLRVCKGGGCCPLFFFSLNRNTVISLYTLTRGSILLPRSRTLPGC